MAVWLSFKATAKERQKKQPKAFYKIRFCKVCGRQLNTPGGDICGSCDNFIKHKQKQERRQNGKRV